MSLSQLVSVAASLCLSCICASLRLSLFVFLGVETAIRDLRPKRLAIKRPRTRSAAVRHWRDLSLSAYERDLATNEKV